MKTFALSCLVSVALAFSVQAKGSAHTSAPVGRLSGLLIASNDGFYQPGPELLRKEVIEALKAHRVKFGNYRVGREKVARETWDPVTKQGKVVVDVTFDRGSDQVFLYYTEIADPQMMRGSPHETEIIAR